MSFDGKGKYRCPAVAFPPRGGELHAVADVVVMDAVFPGRGHLALAGVVFIPVHNRP